MIAKLTSPEDWIKDLPRATGGEAWHAAISGRTQDHPLVIPGAHLRELITKVQQEAQQFGAQLVRQQQNNAKQPSKA